MTFRRLPLGEIAQVKYGRALPAASRSEGNARVFGSNGVVGSHNAAITMAPCIVVGRKGSIGKVHFVSEPCWPIDTAYYIDAWRDDVLPEYLYFALRSADLGSQNKAGAIPSLLRPDLERTAIPLGAVDDQRRIVDHIKECLERVAEIEELKKSSRTQQLYLSASLIESELHSDYTGDEEWSSRTVGELVTTVRNGRSIAQDTAGQANGAVLTLTAVRGIDLGINFQKPIALPEEVARQFGIDADDVFVSRANTIELVGLSAVAMEAPAGRLIYPDLLIKLKVNPSLILPRYLAYALRSASARKQIKARALGSSQTMVKISGERLREVSIPVPSLVEQAKIVSRLDAAHDLMRQLAAESVPGEVELLRSAILRKAFTGEM